ncbi:MAG: bifunctional nicotinamidase/pyrazinamidase [Anaerolineae bacterium]
MKALYIIDIQNDFCPGGALAVDEGDQIVPIVNQLQAKFDLVIMSQDWHPADHGSFAANHPGTNPGEIIDLHGLDQILWPVHCVQGSHGAEFREGLDTHKVAAIFRKGTDETIDSYSGFFDNGQRAATGAFGYLKELGVTDLYLVGLATDYCVKFTAIDGNTLGFNTHVIVDATRGVNLQPGDVDKALDEMDSAGISVVQSADLDF